MFLSNTPYFHVILVHSVVEISSDFTGAKLYHSLPFLLDNIGGGEGVMAV